MTPPSERGLSHVETQDLWPAEKIVLNQKEVVIHRVRHDVSVFEHSDAYFEEAIKNSAVVVLEGAPEAEGIYNDEILQFIMQLAGEHGVQLNIEELRKSIKDSPITKFFHEMENKAARHSKPIAVVDPLNPRYEIVLKKRDQDVAFAKLIAAGSGMVGMLLTDMFFHKRRLDDPLSPLLSRRTFLKGALGATALTGMGSFLSQAGKQMESDPSAYGRKQGIVGPLAYDLQDYRDVVVAQGLDRLTNDPKRNGPVGVIYGASHGESVKHYALSPKERAAKFALYAPFREIREPSLKLFNYENSRWVQNEDIKL